ncbi:E3 SUMO-protein ligase PIAS2-like isoform X2 [Babylonia areolata]|uniref:E3 SUMO-protein ligase PIAS2-like isoform X2 n=1 Tax=Babylonia areolata TaxID=304850 RepID=UPI003FD450CA
MFGNGGFGGTEAHGYELSCLRAASAAGICWSQQKWPETGTARASVAACPERLLYACADQNPGTLQRRRLDGPGGMAAGETPQPMVTPAMAQIGTLDYSSSKNMAAAPVVGPLASAIPIHPDVHLKRLPFYDVLGELLKPTSLMPKSNNRFQESYYVFHLTPQQAQDIAMSRDFRPGTKCEYTVQVQLRFCLLETSCEQDDNFPPSICVRVNSKMAQLPNPIPTNKPGVEPKRPGRPVDITSTCRISPTVSNHLDVSWASEFGRGYCLAVYLVRRLSSDILLQRLKQFGNRHPDHTRALIKEKLAHDPDSEVATTSLRVSLMCPLGKMRMTLPSRSSTCTHLQCFDASTFLLMNEKKPTWICPVCDKPAPFDKLIIDGYFMEIFRQSPESNEIVFNEDGNWMAVKQPKETHVIASPMTPSTISLSDDPSDSTPSTSQRDRGGNKGGDVIDLTQDTSDEEDEVTVKAGGGPDTPVTITPGPSHHTSDANSSSSGCMSPAVINLDAPSPALSVHSLSASPAPMTVSQSPFSSSSSSSTAAPGPPPPAPVLGVPPPAHSYQPLRRTPPTSYHAGNVPPVAATPLMAPGAPLAPGNLGPNMMMPSINLETLSEAEFEDFLHGLSWGV